MRILLVEDEPDLAKSIQKYLDKENFLVDIAENIFKAEENINSFQYECALIDLMLPDGSGYDLIPIIKNNSVSCGIIIITAKNTLDDKIKGLDIGADDYITKPFHLAELNARIKSVIRRRNFLGANKIAFDNLDIDIDKRELKINNNIIEMTKREFDILLFMISNKGRVITKESIVEHIWSNNSQMFDNFDFIYTHIKNLRKKIVENGGKDYIHSIYGIGYKFNLP
jgi:DNA-binding response OmpR family regulator